MYLNIVHHNNQMHPVLIMATAMVNGKRTFYDNVHLRFEGQGDKQMGRGKKENLDLVLV